jgi:hypothetical protein
MRKIYRPLKNIYAIYNKYDEFLFVGNMHECCDYLEVTRSTFYVMLNKHNHNRVKQVCKYMIVKVEDDE